MWRRALQIVVLVHLAFFLVAWLASWMVEPGNIGPPTESWLDIWRRWDAHNLLRLADEGYLIAEPNHTAYLPLFPLAVRAVMTIGIDPVAAGLLVSAAACVVALAFLHTLAEEDAPGSGNRAMLYLAVSPMAVFLVAPYTEALFLAGAIGAFVFARRGRWIAAGVCAAVATGSRAAGVFVLVALVVLWATSAAQPRWTAMVRGIAIGATPLLAYTIYLRVHFGSWTQFFTAQHEGWGRRFTNPLDALRLTSHAGGPDAPRDWIMAWRLEIVAAAIGLAFVGYLLYRRRWPYAVYCGLSLGALLTSTWFYSIPRSMLTWFPIPLALAAFAGRREGRHEAVLIGSTALAVLGVITFTRSAWFF